MDMDQFEQQLYDKVRQSMNRRIREAGQTRQEMMLEEKHSASFAKHADELMDHTLNPRMEKLTVAFNNARLDTDPTALPRHRVAVMFDPTPRLPVAYRLEFGIYRATGKLIVYRHIDIGDSSHERVHDDEISYDLDSFNEGEYTRWIERKILDFTDQYLHAEDDHQIVRDPVCGMNVYRDTAPASVKHGDQTYYFCAESCRDRFRANPEGFVAD